MEVYPQESPMVWGILGKDDRSNQELLEEGLGQIPHQPTCVANDGGENRSSIEYRPLTCTSSDIDDPQLLTPAHLLYGRKIVRLLHECLAEDIKDPNYGNESQLQRQTRTQAHLLKSFQSRWKHEHLTSL